MGLLTRFRQNLSLKIVSLIAAILLYVYVQQERNPTIAKQLIANVEYRNTKEGYEVVPASRQIAVTVTGPKSSVEKLKDGDIKATADVSTVPSNQPGAPVRVTYEMPKAVPDILIEGAQEFIKVQVFHQ